MLSFKKIKISPLFFLFNSIILFLLVLALKVGNIFFYSLMWILIIFEGLNIILVIIQWSQTKKILLSRNIREKTIEGIRLSEEIILSNDSPLPLLNVEIEENLGELSKEGVKNTVLGYIPPRTSLKITYNLNCDKRGRYVIGPIKVFFSDIMGIFSLSREYNIYSVLYVYPSTFDIARFPPLTRGYLPWLGLETRRVSGDEDEFFGLREYRQGDPIKKIHWLSTARKSKLIVKEFQKFSFHRVCILFTLNKEEDVGKDRESVGEYIIKISASLSKYLIERGINVEIIAHAGKFFHFPFNKGSDYLEQLMKFYASVRIESKIKMGDFLEENISLITPNSNLIILSTEKNIQDISKILYLQRYDISFILVVLLSYTFDSYKFPKTEGAFKEFIYKSGAKYFFVSQGDDLRNLFSE